MATQRQAGGRGRPFYLWHEDTPGQFTRYLPPWTTWEEAANARNRILEARAARGEPQWMINRIFSEWHISQTKPTKQPRGSSPQRDFGRAQPSFGSASRDKVTAVRTAADPNRLLRAAADYGRPAHGDGVRFKPRGHDFYVTGRINHIFGRNAHVTIFDSHSLRRMGVKPGMYLGRPVWVKHVRVPVRSLEVIETRAEWQTPGRKSKVRRDWWDSIKRGIKRGMEKKPSTAPSHVPVRQHGTIAQREQQYQAAKARAVASGASLPYLLLFDLPRGRPGRRVVDFVGPYYNRPASQVRDEGIYDPGEKRPYAQVVVLSTEQARMIRAAKATEPGEKRGAVDALLRAFGGRAAAPRKTKARTRRGSARDPGRAQHLGRAGQRRGQGQSTIFVEEREHYGEPSLFFYVNAPGGCEWAKSHHTILGDTWECSEGRRSDFAYAIVSAYPGWQKEARQEYPNVRFKHLEYSPPRQWIGSARRDPQRAGIVGVRDQVSRDRKKPHIDTILDELASSYEMEDPRAIGMHGQLPGWNRQPETDPQFNAAWKAFKNSLSRLSEREAVSILHRAAAGNRIDPRLYQTARAAVKRPTRRDWWSDLKTKASRTYARARSKVGAPLTIRRAGFTALPHDAYKSRRGYMGNVRTSYANLVGLFGRPKVDKDDEVMFFTVVDDQGRTSLISSKQGPSLAQLRRGEHMWTLHGDGDARQLRGFIKRGELRARPQRASRDYGALPRLSPEQRWLRDVQAWQLGLPPPPAPKRKRRSSYKRDRY